MFLDPAWVPIHVSYKVFYEHERRTIKRYELIYTKPMFTSIFDSRMRKEVISRQFQVVLDLCSYSSLVQNVLCKKGLVLLLIGWKKNSLLPVIGFVALSHLLRAAILGRVPNQTNFGHLGFPNQFCESLNFFLCKHFVLLQKTLMAAGRVEWKHSTEHTECAVSVKSFY